MKTKSKTQKDREQSSNLDEFRIALETMRYEGGLLWQIFAAFLLIHTVFASFLLQTVLVRELIDFYPSTFIASIVGLILCIPWWASYSRNAAHYRYHLARVRELEPDGWNLYRGLGQDFSAGKKVKVGYEYYKLSWLAQKVKSGRMIPPVIATFTTIYFAIMIFNGPWW